MERLEYLDAVAAPIVAINCDTDQILPARYLQKPRSDDFGQFLFRALRFDANGAERPDFLLNQAPLRESRIVVANHNFGCGSSREHAVWALYDYGIRAAIAPSFGDIFFINCLKNGLLPIVLPEAVVLPLLDRLSESPGSRIAIDLPAQTVTLPDGSSHAFELEPFAKDCLLRGMDEIDYTLSHLDRIVAFERDRAETF
ncbi:3-isopropylmalate dehydratase small subunit [Caballeronia sp. LP006]|jgi:3-isopropylmalate/(R)-2-methylmalate dehydratase small subunit|uniref:3-isopropylmalate dehydratase small subunit n=1 Tax=unclassified Caballeronia TaxID=2646786 RepID=UPI001FD33391|nr:MULTISPECIES: 3-isopropylmalate dehydratase small subunit [unclassified Caballeronia]MDR5800009.1 3-isopropylmalate dehydratase small subunit [Caballeronia sp. LZ001]MDR5827833.1 3-isopropylmalate dehydratase small subunit [Caballeronia sp. LP006]